ncbi:MAG: hypothetical protein ABIQ13_07945 [Pedococcus sp.]
MSPVRTSVKIAGAAGVAALAAGIGASQALADTTTPTPSGTTRSAPVQDDASGPAGGGGRGGPGHGHGHGHGRGGADAAALAKELGVTQAKVQAALDTVREATKSDRTATRPAEGAKPTPPTAAERSVREKARAASLAKELGLSESKVQAAFDALEADRGAARKTELSGRLDTAVKDGKLTTADKESVLKAYDAGVLGGPRR